MTYERAPVAAFALLFRELSIALRAGFTPADALTIIRQDQAFGRAWPTVETLADHVRGGDSLASAMAKDPGAFASETVALVRAGEDAGRLDPAIAALADDYERRTRGRAALRSALAWPFVLSVVLFVVVSAIAIFVVPVFNDIFASFGSDLPAATLLLISVSDFIANYWWAVAAALVGAALYLVGRRPAPAGQRFVDRMVFRLPVVRTYLITMFVPRLAALLAAAVRGDVPLAPAIAHLRATAGNERLAAASRQLEDQLNAGRDLGAALGGIDTLPRRLGVLAELGGRGGNLEAALAQAVDLYDAEAERAVPAIERTALLVCYLVLGIVVGFTVIAVYLPIFKLGQTI